MPKAWDANDFWCFDSSTVCRIVKCTLIYVFRRAVNDFFAYTELEWSAAAPLKTVGVF